MSNIGIFGGADGPTEILVSCEIHPWMLACFIVGAVCSVASVVLGLVALRKAKKAEQNEEE